jgi:hypothetical protein
MTQVQVVVLVVIVLSILYYVNNCNNCIKTEIAKIERFLIQKHQSDIQTQERKEVKQPIEKSLYNDDDENEEDESGGFMSNGDPSRAPKRTLESSKQQRKPQIVSPIDDFDDEDAFADELENSAVLGMK